MNNNKNKGLTTIEAEINRAKFGANILTPPTKPSLWVRFAEKFKEPIIIILMVALTLSVGVAIYQAATGAEGAHVFLEPVGILFAVVAATLIGFIFEVRANAKFEILSRVNDDSCVKVKRDGEIHIIAKREVVVGDVIIVENGDEVAADCILLESVALQVDESSLTGEPLARKSTDPADSDSEATYPTDHILRDTTVVEGSAVARVIAVGDSTEAGKVHCAAQIDSSVKTPLNEQLESLATLITRLSYAVALLIVAGRTWIYFSTVESFAWLDFGSFALNTIMLAVTVVVVSVPEGLPMSITLSLALSMQRMLQSKNLVRKMHACETMGATTVICTDKTGTLTQNKMQVQEYRFTNSTIASSSIAINTTAHLERSQSPQPKVIGNPTEGALLLWLESQNIDYEHIREQYKIVAQLPFSTERKYMATMACTSTSARNIIYIKGAPEVILSLTNHRDPQTETTLGQWQNSAMRTLAFAYAQSDKADISLEKLEELHPTFVGIVAISDPIRTEVPTSIEACLRAGIAVKVVTGDTSATAKEIARQIGLWSPADPESAHITGAEFEALSDEELLERVAELKIISRARPLDKQRLVQLLQQRGEVVAVTGDGTNDAPALKAAQIGLSMGDGTTVAMQASDITILDNSFTSITRAVMWGRSLYQNIQRFILFQLTINIVACLVVTIGALTGSQPPLTVTQMLWVNLIMDSFAALALASLPPNERVMRATPRKRGEHIITRAMRRNIVGAGLLFSALLFGLMQFFRCNDITTLTQLSIGGYIGSYFNLSAMQGEFSRYESSLFFTIFVMIQFWNLFNAKAFMSESSALRGLGKSRGFLLSALIILVGQYLIVSFGGALFSLEPLSSSDWIAIIAFTSPILIIGEMWRFVRRHLI